MRIVLSIFLLITISIEAELLVRTLTGAYVGHYVPNIPSPVPIVEWKGIRFGAQPQRFGKSEAPPFVDFFDPPIIADIDVPGCPQICTSLGCPDIISEDCLFLTVTAPQGSFEHPPPFGGYPVVVWFHGGFNEYGGGSVEYLVDGVPFLLYNGYGFAANGVITVSVNYRLGFYGFFAAPEYGLDGNYAVSDHFLALKWVQDNIWVFGGNPQRVTIAGESSGALNVLSLLATPSSKGLYSAVLTESAPISVELLDDHRVTTEMIPLTLSLLNSTGLLTEYCPPKYCTSLEALELIPLRTVLTELTVDELLALQNVYSTVARDAGDLQPYTPFVTFDGLIPQQPMVTLMSGQAPITVPIFLGINHDEGVSFIFETIPYPLLNQYEYDAALNEYFGANANQLFDTSNMYPALPTGQDNRYQMAKALTDLGFFCPIKAIGQAFSAVEKNVYIFRFDHLSPYPWDGDVACFDFVCHSYELPYVFGEALYLFNNATITYVDTHTGIPAGAASSEAAAACAVTSQVITAWTNFFKNHNPGPVFPQFSATNDEIAEIDVDITTGSYISAYQCAIFAAAPYVYPAVEGAITPPPSEAPTNRPSKSPSRDYYDGDVDSSSTTSTANNGPSTAVIVSAASIALAVLAVAMYFTWRYCKGRYGTGDNVDKDIGMSDLYNGAWSDNVEIVTSDVNPVPEAMRESISVVSNA